jgi:hypothetical protein
MVAAIPEATQETPMRTRTLRAAFALGALLLSLAAGASPFPRLDQFGKSLNLSPAQQAQFDAAVASTQRVIVAAAIDGMQLKAQVKAEFAKPRPDLEALARAKDASAERLKPLHEASRAEWLRFYATLGDDQVAIVKSFLEDKMEHLDALRQFVLSLMVGRISLGGS